MRLLKIFATVGLSFTLIGCGINEAIFVTTTTIGINAETTPPNLSFAYDRYEGFFGPADEDGNMPPVVARIESNHSIISPKVKQLYATGAAALDVTIDAEAKTSNGKLIVDKRRNDIAAKENGDVITGENNRVALFGVAQTTGLKVTFGPTNVVDAVTIGYKRKEASYLPLVRKTVVESGKSVEKARYPSTLAALTRNVAISNLSDTSEGVSQFFATGDAARNLALSDNIRNLFKANAEAAVKKATDPNEVFVNRYEKDNAYRKGVDAWVSARASELAASDNENEQAIGNECSLLPLLFSEPVCEPMLKELTTIYPGVGG